MGSDNREFTCGVILQLGSHRSDVSHENTISATGCLGGSVLCPYTLHAWMHVSHASFGERGPANALPDHAR